MLIENQKYGTLNDQDRQWLAELLFKAGYTVKKSKRTDGKRSVIGVEYSIGGDMKI